MPELPDVTLYVEALRPRGHTDRLSGDDRAAILRHNRFDADLFALAGDLLTQRRARTIGVEVAT
ncbi:MAG: hypothetical protein IT437_13295 [Phycisphaerales bacterium]|nr:hypothetical protein [Phycisphaerales bacterium]